jgi:hypothetical protein
MSLFKLKAISDHQFDVRSAERRRTLFLGHDVAARFGFLLAHLKMCCHIRYSASWREDMLTTHRQTSAEEFLPTRRSLKSLREAARSCEGCDLYRNATQTVFGDGPKEARVALVGEQPGDMEDRQGRPFVGPAGRILDKALAEADIRREDVYVTMDSARQATHASTTGATAGDSVQAMATRRISSRSASTGSVPGRHRCSSDVGESDRDC